jgi:hypothetical protein
MRRLNHGAAWGNLRRPPPTMSNVRLAAGLAVWAVRGASAFLFEIAVAVALIAAAGAIGAILRWWILG